MSVFAVNCRWNLERCQENHHVLAKNLGHLQLIDRLMMLTIKPIYYCRMGCMRKVDL